MTNKACVKTSDRKRFQHSLVGALDLDQHVLAVPGSGGHQIWADHASTEKLAHLADLTERSSERPSRDTAPLRSTQL